jgi:cold shock CspA family protein
MNGQIVRIVIDHGYLFIVPQGSKTHVFCHMSALRNIAFTEAIVGQRVTYDEGHDAKGRTLALNVRRFDPGPGRSAEDKAESALYVKQSESFIPQSTTVEQPSTPQPSIPRSPTAPPEFVRVERAYPRDYQEQADHDSSAGNKRYRRFR